MSTTPDADFSLELHFLPAWAKESPQKNKFENFRGAPERSRDGDRDRKFTRRDRPPRRPMGGPGGPGAGSGPGRGPGGPRSDRDQRGPRPPRRDGPGRRDDRRGPERPMAPQVILPDVQVAFVPDDAGVDSLSRQIRATGRAYPVFEIAQMVLAKPERHSVTFSVKKKKDEKAGGGAAQPLFLCALDDSLWLSEDDAVRHVLDRHFGTFYQPEKTQIDPPKGVYTFVAQCSLSGAILGPPNHHDYQNQLRRLHQERFGRMPFEMFKSKVKIVRDEAVVKKWIEDQSWKTEFLCLNLPETLKLSTRDEVEKHFRQVHLANIIKPVETHRLTGPASRNLRDRRLAQLLRVRWEEQRRFPMQVATALSQQFAARGLQFFKVNRTITHVAVARPHYLDLEATPVSDGVRKIVEFVNAHPKCTHKQLLETLAPAPTVIPIAPVEGTAPAPAPAEPSPELTAVMMDLHWLVQQGHVIEFANGVLETAKKPLPRPAKPAPAPEDAATPADAAPAEGEVSGTAEPVVTVTEAEAPPAVAVEAPTAAEQPPPATETPAQG